MQHRKEMILTQGVDLRSETLCRLLNQGYALKIQEKRGHLLYKVMADDKAGRLKCYNYTLQTEFRAVIEFVTYGNYLTREIEKL